MKWFYIIAVIGVGVLFAMPFWLLSGQDMSMVQTPVPGFDGQLRKPIVTYDSYSSRIRSLDPATCGDTTSAGIQANFYEGLYTYHYLKRPASEAVIPQLAADMPRVSEDGLTWTIPLKQGIVYRRNEAFGREADAGDETSNTPRFRTREMTAHDFVLAFKRVADPHIPPSLAYSLLEGRVEGIADYRARSAGYRPGDFSRYDKEDIAGIRAVDDHTLEIQLSDPYPQFQYVLAMSVYAPIPREVIDYWLASESSGSGGERVSTPIHRRSPEIRDWRATVGTGPYYLADYNEGGRIVMVRNQDFRPDFYPTEGEPGDREAGLLDDAGKRVPFNDVIYWTFVQETNPAWMLFMTRQNDLSAIPQEQFKNAIADGGVGRDVSPAMKAQGIKLLIYTSPALYYLSFNLNDPVVGKSPSLRKAMSLAFNVQESIDVLRNGRGKWCRSILTSDLPERSAVGDSPYARLDVPLAKQFLQQARVELGLGPDDPLPTIVIDYPSTSQDARRQAELYKSQFGAIGLTVEVELEDWPTYLDRMHRNLMQVAAGSGWHADYPDAENFLQLFYSPNIEAGTNTTNYRNPDYDRLYEQMRVMEPSPERTEIIKRMAAMINEDCPVIFDSEPESFVLMHDWVHNLKPHPIGYGYAKYRRIDADARRAEGGR